MYIYISYIYIYICIYICVCVFSTVADLDVGVRVNEVEELLECVKGTLGGYILIGSTLMGSGPECRRSCS